MKKIRINKKILVMLVSTGIVFSLSSCASKEDSSISSFAADTTSQEDSVSSDSRSDDTEEFDYFSSDLVEVEELIDENEMEELKAKAKDVFTTGVDFIFYDEEISGVTFDELTEEAQEITMSNLESLGNMVDEVIPGWREELSDKYQVASRFVSDIYLSGLDSIREYLGNENYSALENIKNQILDDVSDIYDNAKEHVKSWYEEFRSK